MIPTAIALERAVRAHVARLLETLHGVPHEAINSWRPAAATAGSHEMNTFAALAVHTVSAAEFHALHMVGRQPTDRVRDEEFVATTSEEEIVARFDRFLAGFHDLLAGLTEGDLGERPAPDHPELADWTSADWLMHTLDHIALHTGHLQIHRQLWEYESRGA